jgi:hypothetical protein
MNVIKLSTKWYLSLITMALFATTIYLVGCGDSTSSPAAGVARKYAGAGTDWRWTFNTDGTFSAAESTVPATLTGTYATVSTGFQKLTVATSSGTGAPAANAVIAALEVPGFATIFPPILTSETQVVGTIAGGNCPSSDFTDNYLYLQFDSSIDLTTTNREFFGVFSWNATNSSGQPSAGYLMNYSSYVPGGGYPVLTGTCSNGIMSTSSFVAYLAPGSAFVKSIGGGPTSGDGMVAMPAVTIGSLANLYGNYSGYVYDGTVPSVEMITTSISTGTSSTSFTVQPVSSTDLITPTGTTTTVNFTAIDTPSAGFVEGYVGASSNKLICMAGANVLSSGKNVMFCLVQNPSLNTKPLSVVLVSH